MRGRSLPNDWLEAAMAARHWIRRYFCCRATSIQTPRRWLQPPALRGPPTSDPTAFPRCSISMVARSEEHTSELQSLMRISYAVFCLKTKNNTTHYHHATPHTYT